MAEGGSDPVDDKRVMFDEDDIQLMLHTLMSTGRYEIKPKVNAQESGETKQVTSTPSGGEIPPVSSHFATLGDSHNVPPPVPNPPVPKRDSSRLVVHRLTTPVLANPQIAQSPNLNPDGRKPHVHFENTHHAGIKAEPTTFQTQYTTPIGTLHNTLPHHPNLTYNTSGYNNTLESSHLANMRVPQLPFFSGENQKGEVSFEVWKFELNCLIRECIYPNSLILQALRKSLKSKARDILLTLNETSTPSDVLLKLEGIYGNVSSNEVLMQQFYLERQKADESVADYSIRIENLLRRATQSRHIQDSIKNEMLCSKLWNGLKDPLLKNSSRYKYEVEKDFNNLRREIRSIEQDLQSSDNTTTDRQGPKQLQQSAETNTTDQKLDGLFQQMKLLKQKMDSLETRLNQRDPQPQDTSKKETSHTVQPSPPFRSYTPRGRGGYTQFRGRGRTNYRGSTYQRGSYSNPNRGGGNQSKREDDKNSSN